MEKRNGGWTCYLRKGIGRQVLWFILALSATSLLMADNLTSASFPHLAFGNDPDHFLSYNGIDDAVSACKYYKAIEAITERVDCEDVTIEAKGFFTSDDKLPDGVTPKALGISFDEWKKKNGFLRCGGAGRLVGGEFCNEDTDRVSAVYFNAVDLRLPRSMYGKTSIVDREKRTAYYVCNFGMISEAKKDHENSRDPAFITGFDADACVAFDFSESRRFTKFYIFKRRDEFFDMQRLAASANLEVGFGAQTKEKFVPGLCKACHGSDKQPLVPFSDNGDKGDVGAHFLPFDLDNFTFEGTGFTRQDQETQFKELNEMILETNYTPAVKELIDGWYAGGGRTEQDSGFIPPGWKGHEQLYRIVVKPACRTCHVVMLPGTNFNRFEEFDRGRVRERVCLDPPTPDPVEVARRRRSMPNSYVTFDRFWLDRVARAVLQRFLQEACPPPP